MVDETDINKSIIKKIKMKKKCSVGLTDVNEIQYKELQKLWTILQKAKKE
tara:strand:+ start:637 stop:786 length:150 start_codon:yes stop_codon:yes gene_type:complete